MAPSPVDWPALFAAARVVRQRAYAPYSGYLVGAAVLAPSGRIYAGCNVENATYGLTICAERSALAHMVAAGEREPLALAVVTPGPRLAMPCGMCRQSLAELAADLPIQVAVGDEASAAATTLAVLLPEAFRADTLEAARKG